MPKITRRAFIKGFFGTIFTSFGITAGGLFYAGKIEPRLLKITELDLTFPALPQAFNEIKIIQMNDTHLGFQYTLEQLDELITTIHKYNPDMVFFVGDLLDEPNKFTEMDRVIELLRSIQAPLGKYAVYGNHDHGGYGTNIYGKIMEESDFHLLLNEAMKIEIANEAIYILGIDDAMLGKPNITSAIKGVPDASFKILLSHAPDLADMAAKYPIHLQLSGHSHGGQIKIPFLGAAVKPPYGKKYVEGLYEVQDLSLYVNRGIGTTRLPYRFFSVPEMTVITLRTE